MPSKPTGSSQSKASTYISNRRTRSIKLHNLRQRLRRAGQNLFALGQVNHELRLLRLRRQHQGVARAKDLFKELGSKAISSRDILNVLDGTQPPHENVFLHHCRWALAAEQYHEAQERRCQADFVNEELTRLRRPIEEVLKCSLLPPAIKDSLRKEITEIESELDAFRSFLTDNAVTIPHPFTVTPYDPRDQNTHGKRHKSSDWPRNSFWTPVIGALCSIWKKAGQTNYRAFKDIARLLSLMFPPFPDEQNLVKQRFYYERRSTNHKR